MRRLPYYNSPVRSIVILGAGELGGALARQLAAADICSRIILVDGHGRVAEGKALDIRQSAPVDGYSTLVTGSTDETSVVGADVIVVADRSAGGVEWHDDDGVALVRRTAHINDDAMILCAGARHLEVVERGVREGGLSRQRIFGSAPEALRAAIISMTALEAGCSPMEISLAVVGRPPSQVIVPWEDASIGGRRATQVLTPPAITRLDARLPRLWPPGPLTLASAATRVLRAAATRQRLSLCAFVAVTREEGEQGRVAMLPILARPQGVAAVLTPTLTSRDRVRLETALRCHHRGACCVGCASQPRPRHRGGPMRSITNAPSHSTDRASRNGPPAPTVRMAAISTIARGRPKFSVHPTPRRVGTNSAGS